MVKREEIRKTYCSEFCGVFSPFSSPLPNVLGISRHGVVENIMWDHVNGTKGNSARHGTARKWQLTWSSMLLDR